MAEGSDEKIKRTYYSKIADIVNRCSGSDASYRIDGQEKLWAAGKRTNTDDGSLCLLKVDMQAD